MLHPRTAHHDAFRAYADSHAQRPARHAAADDEEGPGLLVSPAFWIGGVLSLAVWVGLAAAFGVI